MLKFYFGFVRWFVDLKSDLGFGIRVFEIFGGNKHKFRINAFGAVDSMQIYEWEKFWKLFWKHAFCSFTAKVIGGEFFWEVYILLMDKKFMNVLQSMI